MNWTIIKEKTLPCNTLSVRGCKRSLRVVLCKEEGKIFGYFVQIFGIRHDRDRDYAFGGCCSDRVSHDEGDKIFNSLLNDPDGSYDEAHQLHADYDRMLEPYC